MENNQSKNPKKELKKEIRFNRIRFMRLKTTDCKEINRIPWLIRWISLIWLDLCSQDIHFNNNSTSSSSHNSNMLLLILSRREHRATIPTLTLNFRLQTKRRVKSMIYELMRIRSTLVHSLLELIIGCANHNIKTNTIIFSSLYLITPPIYSLCTFMGLFASWLIV